MKACGIFVASLFGALVAAAPVNKRDIVWVTETAVDVVTIPVTKTVWVGADEAEATSTSAAAHNFAHQPKTRHTFSTTSTEVAPVASSSVYVAPTTSSSVYVEPTTSSTSIYVEPTTSSTSVYVEPTTSSTSVYVEPTPTSTSVYVAPTTTSAYVAPTTSETSVYVAPTTTEAPTSTYEAPSSTSSAPAATTSASSGGSSSGLAASGTSYTGDVTWYETGSGACGWTNAGTESIVAISKTIFDDPEYYSANPNNNPLCGRFISITATDGSKHQAKVVDRCVGCEETAIDLSSTLFNTVTGNGDGRVHGMTWTWV